MKRLLIVLLSLSLFCCTPQKRLNRLVKNHPELVQHDTIFKMDTTVVNGVMHDTIFKTQITKDTVTIIDKQLTIKYFNDGKTTYIKGVCDTVWAVKEVPVMVNNTNAIISNETWYEKLMKYLNLIILALLLLLLFRK